MLSLGHNQSKHQHWPFSSRLYIFNGLVQERRNSIVNAPELRLSCHSPSHWFFLCCQPHRMGHGQHLNSLWPSDTIWRQRSGSTLAQVMACCLTAPSHYLNQCWLIISEVQWQFHKRCLGHQSLKSLWKQHLKFHSNFPGANDLI